MPAPVPTILYTAQNGEWISPGRPNVSAGQVDPGPTLSRLRVNGVRLTGPAVVAPPVGTSDWSDSNLPWAYEDESVFTEDWPAGTTVVDIQTGSSDFYTNLQNTVNAAGKRVVVRLGIGTYHLKSFRLIGSSGLLDYAMGFWFPNLQGLLGRGADKTFVQMDANSMTQAQIDNLGNNPTMASSAFNPNDMSFCRLDGVNPASPVLLAGVTFQAADQQMLTTKQPDVPIVIPQPAPHMGVFIYPGSTSIISYCRFLAAGRAATSSPPFESANITSSRGTHHWHHCEFDGRRAPWIDPLRPRRTSTVMANNENSHRLEDSWLHHSNVSRYAVNDENANTQGNYVVRRCKLEYLTDQQNRDPNLNGGNSLGGWTNVTLLGWESTNARIDMSDNTLVVTNPSSSGQFPAHYQFTTTGSRNPNGGRIYIVGDIPKNIIHPQLDGYYTFRIQKSTSWFTEGVANTIDVRKTAGGTKLLPWEYTGAWPPSAAAIAAAGISKNTHFIWKAA
jgi:hypothetical protein